MLRCPGANKRQSVESPAGGNDSDRKRVKREAEKEKAGKGAKRTEDVKNIENAKWWGGDLKDIYTDRRKKKVDYLEVSDMEDSDDEKGDDTPSTEKKNLSKESPVSSSSEDEEESATNKKIVKKKLVKEKNEKKSNRPALAKSIAVHVFKGKQKEDSSDEAAEVSAAGPSQAAPAGKEARSRKSDVMPITERPVSPKPKAKKKPPNKRQEKMVTSDSEPEIVKKEVIKIEDDSEEKTTALAEHDLLSNKIREKLLSNKSEKVKCGNCNKSLKNSIILQYHQLHCTPAPRQDRKVPAPSSLGAVEKKIIDSKKSTASPVDMILKKLTEKVASSPTSPSPGSSYKFFKTKTGEERPSGSAGGKPCKICGTNVELKQMEDHIKTCHDQKISVSVKKISKTELPKSPPKPASQAKAGAPAWKKVGKIAAVTPKPLAKHPPSMQLSKPKEIIANNVPKIVKQVVKKDAVKQTKVLPKKKLPVGSSDSDGLGRGTKQSPKSNRKSYTEDSDSDEDSEFEVNTKKRKPTQYCFDSCFEAESNEMIG
jgi:hypothetical protein